MLSYITMNSVWNYIIFVSSNLLPQVVASGGDVGAQLKFEVEGEDDESGIRNLSAEGCACSAPTDFDEITIVRILATFPGWIPFPDAADAFMADRDGSAKVIIDYRDFNSFDEAMDEIRANGNMEEGYYDGFMR